MAAAAAQEQDWWPGPAPTWRHSRPGQLSSKRIFERVPKQPSIEAGSTTVSTTTTVEAGSGDPRLLPARLPPGGRGGGGLHSRAARPRRSRSRRCCWPWRRARYAARRGGGRSQRALCDDCKRVKEEEGPAFTGFRQTPGSGAVPDGQGIICAGSVARRAAACAAPTAACPPRLPARAPRQNQGAKLVSAVARSSTARIRGISASWTGAGHHGLPPFRLARIAAAEVSSMPRTIIDPSRGWKATARSRSSWTTSRVKDILPDPRLRGFERFVVGRPIGAAAHRHAHLRRLPGQPPWPAPRPWTAFAGRSRPWPTSCATCSTTYYIHSHIAHLRPGRAGFVCGPDATPPRATSRGWWPRGWRSAGR